jgi:GTP pyrophosphokinase
MSISTVLNNGDTVEIILSNKAKPSIDWLNFARTSSAKQKIRQFLREANRDNLIEDGKQYLQSYLHEFGLKILEQKILNQRIKDSRLPYNSLEDALIALAEKDLPKISLLKALYPNFNNSQKIKLVNYQEKTGIDSLAGIKYGYAGCCQSRETNNLIGYVASDHIIKIHNKNCRFVKKADKKRLIDI